MAVRTLTRSFAGGEITPEMFGRLDLDKFQSGVAKAHNFRILAHGPAQNRAGFKYVMHTAAQAFPSRLIPFAFSAEQTMVLEFGGGYVRFHTNGGTLLDLTLTITDVSQAEPGVLTYSGTDPDNDDVVYLSGIGGMTELNGRWAMAKSVNAAANTFELYELDGTTPIDTTALTAYTAGGTAQRVYEVATPYVSADLFDIHYTQSADVLTLVHPGYAVRELRRLGATNWTLTVTDFEPAVETPAAPTVTATTNGATNLIDYFYKVTAVTATEESLASADGSDQNNLAYSGAYNTVAITPVTGALRYYIYKRDQGGLYGYIGQSNGEDFNDANVTPDMTRTPPEANDPFSGSGNRPGAVTYAEQRRCFAGTDNLPQNIWMTRSATESNMTQSIPIQDDDAIVFRLAANQQNRIRHLVPLGDLIALTAGSVFRIFPANGDILTPASVKPHPQTYVGANNVQPVVAENACLYAQAAGGHVRELAYEGSTDGTAGAVYRSNDISLLAPHLFDGYTIVDMAYSAAPVPTHWVVRSDGVLLGMTYVPGQNVRAWHHHTTDGAFESVAVAAEGGEDVLYAIVRRTIGGATCRYVERLQPRAFDSIEDAFFVDSGLTYNGAPATTISGLWHLRGEAVAVLADGGVVGGLTVSDAGTITLPQAASKVHVGLAIPTPTLRTLPATLEAAAAFGQGAVKNVSKAHFRVHQSGAGWVGPTGGTLVEQKHRTTESWGSPPEPRDGFFHTVLKGKWDEDGGVTYEMRNPLPVTITQLVLEVETGG